MKKVVLLVVYLVMAASILSAQDQYRPQYLKHYQELYDSYSELDRKTEDGSTPSTIIRIPAKMFAGMSVVVFTGEILDLTEADRKHILDWQTALGLSDMSDSYRRKILVEEYEHTYWIIMHDEQIQYLDDNEVILLYYYFIGGYSTDALFISMGFRD